MPEKFHQYSITETLSKKYSHTTYLASPTSEPERQVVLTVFASLLFRFPHERESLLEKAQRLKQLQHPHLVPILDMGIEEEQPFVVREYLPDDSLRSRLKVVFPNRLLLRDALDIVLQIGEALVYAHEHHIIHSNIKPENILLDGNGQAVLMDFSLVSKKDAIIRDQAAEEYAFCYMAPEQFAGTCDARSDQYALGCLIYELITGRVPFASQTLVSMLGYHNNSQPMPLSESVADLPPSLEAAVLKALAKDPAERFFDFSLFLEIIRSVLSPPPAFPLARSARSHRNGSVSQAVQVTEAESPLSPIRKHAAKRAVRQPSEESEASSNGEVERAEPAGTLIVSDESILEWAGTIPPSESLASLLDSHQFLSPLSEETDLVDKRANEEEQPNLLLADPFVEKDGDALPVIDSLSSIYRHNEDATRHMTLALARDADRRRPWTTQLLYGRRRVLVQAVLLSVIVALILYAFLPLVMPISNIRVQTPNKMAHRVTMQTTSMSTVLASGRITVLPTVQPSVTATLTTQPIVLVTSIPTSQPSIPTPTPTVPKSYEAESPQNTRGSGTYVFDCSFCSGGKRVGDIAYDPTYSLRFNNIWEPSTGNYTLTIYYLISGTDTLSLSMSVNSEPETTFNVPSTPNDSTVGTDSVTVGLKAGNNTIRFSNNSPGATDWGPDLDRIIV